MTQTQETDLQVEFVMELHRVLAEYVARYPDQEANFLELAKTFFPMRPHDAAGIGDIIELKGVV